MSMRSVSSTNSGLPSATSAMRARASTAISAPPSRFEMRPSVSAPVSGFSVTSGALGRPVVQPGRASSSSGRAWQTISTGAPWIRSARYSSRSRNVGSPQWMSSRTTISGRRAASLLQQLAHRPEGLLRPRRVAADRAGRPARACTGAPGAGAHQPASLRRGLPRASRASLDPGGLAQHGDDRPERDPLAVGQAPALERPSHGRRLREQLAGQPRLPHAGGPEHGGQLAPPGSATVRVERRLAARQLRTRARPAASRGAGSSPRAPRMTPAAAMPRPARPCPSARGTDGSAATASRTSR